MGEVVRIMIMCHCGSTGTRVHVLLYIRTRVCRQMCDDVKTVVCGTVIFTGSGDGRGRRIPGVREFAVLIMRCVCFRFTYPHHPGQCTILSLPISILTTLQILVPVL